MVKSTHCSSRRLRVQFSALTWCTVYNSGPRGSDVLFWLPQAPGINAGYRHTCRQNSHTHKFKNFFFGNTIYNIIKKDLSGHGQSFPAESRGICHSRITLHVSSFVRVSASYLQLDIWWLNVWGWDFCVIVSLTNVWEEYKGKSYFSFEVPAQGWVDLLPFGKTETLCWKGMADTVLHGRQRRSKGWGWDGRSEAHTSSDLLPPARPSVWVFTTSMLSNCEAIVIWYKHNMNLLIRSRVFTILAPP